jgi:predicted N-formylglutamate amidohydrolase
MKDMGSYYIFNENGKNNNIILTCEHGNAEMPEGYGTLGLSEEDFNSTIGNDKGAKGLAVSLAKKLDCTLFLNKYSRVLIDLNRSMEKRGLIKMKSHTVEIPDNKTIDEAEFQKRVNEYYLPYLKAIDEKIKEQDIKNIISVHSFTPFPRFFTYPREESACVSFSKENPIASLISSGLKTDESLIIGVNKPFDLSNPEKNGNGVAYKYGLQNLNSVLVEVKNDLIYDDETQEKWAEKIYKTLPTSVKKPD